MQKCTALTKYHVRSFISNERLTHTRGTAIYMNAYAIYSVFNIYFIALTLFNNFIMLKNEHCCVSTCNWQTLFFKHRKQSVFLCVSETEQLPGTGGIVENSIVLAWNSLHYSQNIRSYQKDFKLSTHLEKSFEDNCVSFSLNCIGNHSKLFDNRRCHHRTKCQERFCRANKKQCFSNAFLFEIKINKTSPRIPIRFGFWFWFRSWTFKRQRKSQTHCK